jgi:hypothetical protein
MGKTIKILAPVFLLTLALVLPTMAQFGPPAGFEGMSGPPAGFDMGSIPSGFDMGNIPDGSNMGPPEGASGMQGKGEEMKKKGLEKMRKAAKQMTKAITQMEKAVAGVEKAGYTASQEVKDSIVKAKAAVATIETTTDFDAGMAAMDDFNAFIDVLDANIEAMNMLANFPKILKQATRTLDQLQKNFDKMKAKVAKTEMDLSENINGIQAKIDAIKLVYTQAQDLAKAGDATGAFDKLENEFFEPMQDAFQSVGMLQAAINLTTAVKNVDKGIKNAEKVITKMKKKEFETTGLQTIVDQAKAKAVELKAIVKTKDFDPDTAVAVLEELDTLQSDFMDKVDELTDGETKGLGNVTFFNATTPAMPKEFTAGPPAGAERMDFGF